MSVLALMSVLRKTSVAAGSQRQRQRGLNSLSVTNHSFFLLVNPVWRRLQCFDDRAFLKPCRSTQAQVKHAQLIDFGAIF